MLLTMCSFINRCLVCSYNWMSDSFIFYYDFVAIGKMTVLFKCLLKYLLFDQYQRVPSGYSDSPMKRESVQYDNSQQYGSCHEDESFLGIVLELSTASRHCIGRKRSLQYSLSFFYCSIFLCLVCLIFYQQQCSMLTSINMSLYKDCLCSASE